MAEKPILRRAVAGAKIKANDYNWNFDQMGNYVSETVEEIEAGNFVNKSGDTMTGNLTISQYSQPGVTLKNSDFDLENITTPSEKVILNGYTGVDKNNKYYSYYQTAINEYDKLYSSLGVRRYVEEQGFVTSNIGVYIDQDGVAYATAPTPYKTDCSTKIATTEFCDGHWVNKYVRLANEVAINNGETKTFSLDSYLPNDGNLYEVIATGYVETAATSGSIAYLSMKTDFITGTMILLQAATTANKTAYDTFQCTLLSGGGRSITVTSVSSSVNQSNFDFRLHAYRRVR